MAGCSGSRTSSAKKNSRRHAQGSVSFSSYCPPCYGAVTASPCSELSMISKSVLSRVSAVGCQLSRWAQPCSPWQRQDGLFACDSLGEGFQDRELLEGPSIGLHSCSNKNPSCASLLVATGIDLQSSRPLLASRCLISCLCCRDVVRWIRDQFHRIEEGMSENNTRQRSTPCLET